MDLNKRDLEWFNEIQSGNEIAFTQLFHAYYSALCRFALIIVKDRTSAEEIVQQLFINLWQKAGKLVIHSSVKAYLFTSTRYESIHFLNSVNKNLELDEVENFELVSNDKIPSELLEQKDLAKIINECISRLPARCRQVFILHKVDGLKYREISEILEISEKTVENHLIKALRIIRQTIRSSQPID